MPIGEQVAQVLDGVTSPSDAIRVLMARSAKPEFDGLPTAPGTE
jgi:glycerol-3-phosphate dehydrogenase